MSAKKLLIAILLLSTCAMAQTLIGSPYDHGPSLPASCLATNSSGALFFKTAATVGLYQCLTANTWTAVGTAPFATGGTTLHQIPQSNGAGQLVDSIALSEVYPLFTVNENQTLNGTLAAIGGLTLTNVTAPTNLAAIQGAATGGFLLHNQAYFYKVTALSSVGETTVSNESTFTTGAAPVGDTYTATLTWDAMTGATGYKVYRSTTTNTETLLATISAGNTNSYTDNTNTTPSGAMPTTNTSSSIRVTAGTVNAPSININGTSGIYSAGSGSTDFTDGTVRQVAIGTSGSDGQVGILGTTGGISWANSGTFLTSSATAGLLTLGTSKSATDGKLSLGTIQYRGLAQTYFVASNFTSAGNTNHQTITGLSWTMPASIAMNIKVNCDILYSIATAAVAVDFGYSIATVAPTNLNATALMSTNTTVHTEATLQNQSSTTTGQSVVSATPSAITTIWRTQMTLFIEHPSNASSAAYAITVKTANASDLPTVYRGSSCTLQQ